MSCPEFEERLSDYLNNDLDGAGRVALRLEIERDPEAAGTFDEALGLEALLVAAHCDAGIESRVMRGLKRRINESNIIHGVSFRCWAAAAAAVIVSAGLLWLTLHKPSHNLVASNSVESGLIVARDGVATNEIPDGVSFRVQGTLPAVVRLRDGSRVELAPGSEGTFRSNAGPLRQIFVLTSGQGSFQVIHGGGRFRVETPLGNITVFGTEFSVALRPGEESKAAPNQTTNNMTNKTKAVMALAVAVTVGNVHLDIGGRSYSLSAGQTAYAAEPEGATGEVKSLVTTGYIHDPKTSKDDLNLGSFLLGGRNESQTVFRTGVKKGEREAQILLDGRKATFQDAIKPGRKATVTYVKVGNELWVSKVEVVTDPAKEPGGVK